MKNNLTPKDIKDICDLFLPEFKKFVEAETSAQIQSFLAQGLEERVRKIEEKTGLIAPEENWGFQPLESRINRLEFALRKENRTGKVIPLQETPSGEAA